MNITYNNKPYTLDIEKSIKLGVLKPVLPPTKNIALTEDEAAVLYAIFSNIGGSHAGARGQTQSVSNKIYKEFGYPTTSLNLTIDKKNSSEGCIYFIS